MQKKMLKMIIDFRKKKYIYKMYASRKKLEKECLAFSNIYRITSCRNKRQIWREKAKSTALRAFCAFFYQFQLDIGHSDRDKENSLIK